MDPLDVADKYGADTLRTYILFMGDYGASTPWNENSVRGCKRFLDRVYRIFEKVTDENLHSLDNPLHKAIKKVSDDIEDMSMYYIMCRRTYDAPHPLPRGRT